MYLQRDEEYLELSERYEQMFGEDFPGYIYELEESKKIIRACLENGKPYNLTDDPEYNPDAIY